MVQLGVVLVFQRKSRWICR